jgi:peptidoglycan LD-endopeptidase LytH
VTLEKPLIRRLLARLLQWASATPTRHRVTLIGLAVLLTALLYGGPRLFRLLWRAADSRGQAFTRWFTGSEEEREALVTVRREACPGAPFILPADGYIGLLYGDSRSPYSAAHLHQGIDIFSAGPPGVTPVYAAYDGYVSRESGWISALIQRVPDDPLQPGRQIWLYYTHMANEAGTEIYIDEAFPPGTREVFVEQGTLLGYTGNYGGSHRVAVHLHFSIVLDNGSGGYSNELEFDNTVDPSRYLGMAVNYACAPEVVACTEEPLCRDAVLGRGGG